MGNELTRKKNRAHLYFEPDQKSPLQFDDTLRIYLDSPKTTYETGKMPQIVISLKNESKKTRFFKRVWSQSGAEGSTFRIFIDDVESWGSGIFKR